MARDRQRAKQRKQKRPPNQPSEPSPPGREPSDNGIVPDARGIHRENVPGPVEHTGEVDEFEAQLVAGAGGEPEDDPDAVDQAALGGDLDADARAVAAGPRESPATAPVPREKGRFRNFLRASWAELQRVQWPDRRQVGQATAVVLGFVVIAGAFLGLADVVAEQIVDLII